MQKQAWEFSDVTPERIGLVVAVAVVVGVLSRFDRKQSLRLLWGSLVARLAVLVWLSLPFLGLAMWQIQFEQQPGNFNILVDRTASVQLRQDVRNAINTTARELATELATKGQVQTFTYVGRGQPEFWLNGDHPDTAAGGPTLLTRDLNRVPVQTADDQTTILISDGADHSLSGNQAITTNVAAIVIPKKASFPSPVMLQSIDSDAYALVRSPLRFTVTVARQDVARQQQVQIAIDSDGTSLATTTATFMPGNLTATTHLDVLPTHEGRQVFRTTITGEGVEPVQFVHQSHKAVRVIRDRIRVLHVVGRPDWETRLLRENLQQDPAIDLVSFQILRTRKDNPAARNEELSLIPFPTKELFTVELPKFDVVIFQNFNYAPYFEPKFRHTLLDNLQKFVIRDGGGFAMTAGDLSFGYGNYHATPIRKILPVTWRALGQWNYGKYQVNDGKWSSWFGVPAPTETRLSRVYNVQALPDTRTVWQAGGSPLFVAGNRGKGRTAALMTDQLWNLAYSDNASDRLRISEFWSRLIRYLSGDPEFEDLHVDWDSDATIPGAPVKGHSSPSTTGAEIVDATEKTINKIADVDSFEFVAPASTSILYLKSGDSRAPEPLIVEHSLRERTGLEIDYPAWNQWADNADAALYWLESWRSSDLLDRLQEKSRRITHRDFSDITEFPVYWIIGALLILIEIAVRRFSGGA